MSTPDIDAVVAVHHIERPFVRCVASMVDGAAGRVRVTLACHELDADAVGAQLPDRLRPHVRLLEVRDGLRSPAGPFNAGLDAAEAPFVAIAGSDDFVEPGALPAWADLASSLGSDAVLARIRRQDGPAVRTPRVRPGRWRDLDLVKDRLAYRTAPLGLLRRATLDELGLRLTAGLPSGEDIAFTAQLWSEARVDLARSAPAYVVGLDAKDRTTAVRRPVEVELRPIEHLLEQPFFRRLAAGQRRALAVKAVRIHVLGAVLARTGPGAWDEAQVAWLRTLAERCVDAAPDVLRPFNRADRALLEVVRDASSTPASLAAAAASRGGAGRWDALLTPRPQDNADRESTLRYYAAEALDRRVPAAR
ncbi:glycosyltransferase family 2 protein [Georgenia faecalis]|uniref:Glycosyltransferase family 2 protein n=1 Tax=Georgenia faecalis TaxID=2483799 RepID=A0ABV9DCQ4_9MICO|nr:glycosyltransferase family 2 protein [Georgenia faecalis]